MAQWIVSPKDLPAKDLPAKPIHVQGDGLTTGIVPQVAPHLDIFGDAQDQAPIPRLGVGTGAALSDNSLLTSVVYHMDRIANPDINPKPGSIEGIRRDDEIHVYVARFFDRNAVALFPGVVGKQLATSLTSPNERLRPLYDAFMLTDG